MINGFDVDVKTKKFQNATIGDLGKIRMHDLDALRDSVFKKGILRDYIARYRGKLHPKFSKIVSIN